jgi:hypothetical protein
VNELYIERSGPKRRAKQIGHRLPIDAGYLSQTSEHIKALLASLERELRTKYSGYEYTRVGALNRLWDWAFLRPSGTISPICRFEDYWEVHADGKRVHRKENSRYTTMSTSERMTFWVFMTHFNYSGNSLLAEGFSMRSLDRRSREVMLHLLRVIDRFF